MIGRAAELQSLLGRVDAMCARAHSQNVVFVTGEAGMGKTTLLRAVEDRLTRRQQNGAAAQAPIVVSTECSTPLLGQDVGQAEALEPWAELLEDIVRHDGSPAKKKEMAKLVASVALAWTHCVPVVGGLLHSSIETMMVVREHSAEAKKKEHATSQEQMFQQYVNFLSKASDAHPLVLILDDFHWADTSSTNLLFSAARRLLGKRVLFIVAYRAEDAASSRGGQGHPLIHVRNELGRYSQAVDIVVPALGNTDLKGLLRTRYSRYQDNDPFERWLVERSGGNALFITQYLSTLEEDGIVGEQTGELKARFESVRVPTTAFSVVEERIRRLDDDSKELLRYASVEGATFTLAVLAAMADVPKLKLLGRLRVLAEKHGVIGSLGKQRLYASESTTYQFANVLMQRALYESLEEEEREFLHARVFGAIKDDWQTAPERESSIVGLAVRLAAHAEAPEDRHFAAKLLLDAARASWARCADEETLSLLGLLGKQLETLESARAAAGKPGRAEVRELAAEADMVAGFVHKFRHRYDSAIKHFRAARAIYERLGDERRALEPMMREAFTLENAHRWDEAEALSKEVLARAEKLGDERVRGAMLNNLGLTVLGLGHPLRGLEYQQQSLEVREAIGDRVGQAVSLGSMGLAYFTIGELDKALDHHRRALAIREELGDRVGQGYSLTNIGNALAAADSLEEALEYHHRSVAVREVCGDVVRLADSLANEGQLLVKLDRYEEAIEKFAHSLRLRETLGNPRNEMTSLIDLGKLLHGTGELGRSRRLLERALRLARQLGAEATVVSIETELVNLPPLADEEPTPAAASAILEGLEGLEGETVPPPPALATAGVAMPATDLPWLVRAALWIYEKVEDPYGT